jgi:hypothetical protein
MPGKGRARELEGTPPMDKGSTCQSYVLHITHTINTLLLSILSHTVSPVVHLLMSLAIYISVRLATYIQLEPPKAVFYPAAHVGGRVSRAHTCIGSGLCRYKGINALTAIHIVTVLQHTSQSSTMSRNIPQGKFWTGFQWPR